MELLKKAIKYYNDLRKEKLLRKRLVNKDFDYDYLEKLINQVSINTDLVVSIKTQDGSLITIRNEKKQEKHEVFDLQEIMVK